MTRTGAAAGHSGYFHEALCFTGDEDLLAATVPFVLGGIAAGEPTVISLSERNTELVCSALPAGTPVTILSGGAIYARPAGAIRAYRKVMAEHVEAGATQIRIVGEVAPDGFGVTWDSWARYEAAINRAYDDFPLWSMCAYDTRRTPPPMLADVLSTHPRLALPAGGHATNSAFVDPVTYLSDRRPPWPDPIEHTSPLLDLSAPSPADARQAVRSTDHGQVPADEFDDLLVSVSEAVTNAHRHGRAPVRLRLWSASDRIVVSVTDGGPGPKDPFAGLLPTGDGLNGGLGLWITHQSCSHVALYQTEDGFTIRLTAGNPYHT